MCKSVTMAWGCVRVSAFIDNENCFKKHQCLLCIMLSYGSYFWLHCMQSRLGPCVGQVDVVSQRMMVAGVRLCICGPLCACF